MANLVEQLRKLSAKHRERVDSATAIAEKMKLTIEAAKEAGRGEKK